MTDRIQHARANQYNTPSLVRQLMSRHHETESGCWEWQGTIHNNGYGVLHQKSKRIMAHRFAYEFFNGPIPAGHHVCHRCDNKTCVNPAHLFVGSDAENSADAASKGLYRNMGRSGEANPSSKLTEDDVRRLLNMRRTGASYQQIAAVFGISQSQVGSIVRGEDWPALAPLSEAGYTEAQ